MADRVTITVPPDVERVRAKIPSDIARSGKGDLLVRPGTTISVTLEEHAFLRKAHPELFPKLLSYSVPRTVVPVQIEVPEHADRSAAGKPRKLTRSCLGALHVRPGSTLTLSEDERDHLKAVEPALFAQLLRHKPGRSLADIPARAASTEADEPAPGSKPSPHTSTEPPPSQ